MATRTALNASDLFVVLEKAFRRRARDCCSCTFSMPYSRSGRGTLRDDWSVILTNSCSPRCRALLEEIIHRYRSEYELAV